MPVIAAHLEEKLPTVFAADPLQVAGSAIAIDVVEGQRSAVGIEAGGRNQHILATKLPPPARTQAPVGAAAQRQAGLGTHALAATGDDVDHAEHRIAAIDGSAGATDDFDAFDEANVQWKGRIDGNVGVDVFIDRHAVDQDLQARPIVAGLRDAAHAGKAVGVVAGDVEALQRTQRVTKGSPAVETNILAGQNGNDRRNLVRVFSKFWSRDDSDLEQLFERKIDGIDGRRARG